MTVEWHITYDGKTEVVPDQHVFVFQTADGWFAVV